MPDDSFFQILYSSERVHNLPRKNIFHYRIHGEITTSRSFRSTNKWVNENFKIPVSFSRSMFLSRHCYVDVIPLQRIDTKTASVGQRFSHLRQNFKQNLRLNAMDFDIHIFVFNAKDFIPHKTADVESSAAFSAYQICDFLCNDTHIKIILLFWSCHNDFVSTKKAPGSSEG